MTSVTATAKPRHTGRSAVVPHRGPHPVTQPGKARGGRGTFGKIQLVTAEIALVAAGLAAVSGSPVAMAVAGGVGLVVLLFGWGRVGGRWLYEAVAARSALRRRRAAAARPVKWGGPQALQIHNHDDRGSALGIGRDARGWFAAIAVGGDDSLISDDQQTVRLDRLTKLLDEGSARPSSIQIVSLRVSGPSTLLPQRSACVESYRELQRSLVNAGHGLAADLTWIAVRLDAEDALEATMERGGGVEGVGKAIAAAVGRVAKLLASSGVTYRVLDGESLRDALDVSCGFDPIGSPDAAAGESWRGWSGQDLAQYAFEVQRWPSRPTSDSLSQLLDIPADRLVVSVALRPGDTRLRIGTIVRVMTSPDQLTAARQRLAEQAARVGFQLRPLHGLHGPAVLASAPTGGQPL